ncbi:Oligosaccharide translocase SypK [Vibrio jasicida]|uniref:lipopolysaccharide biosynthesis protein n=1 Tax=Vibrio jasicida TaxID=766224 RepID=UPI002893B92D|nr:Oligosaccharide translocase SypK [Vibrio jasicida]CAH1608646.1 Oligosaccharide translocase SypK [Vibrio jasicida]
MSRAMTNMSLFAIALVINKSISLIMLPILPQYLTPEQIGKMEIIASVGIVIALIISLALHEALNRFAGVEDDPQKRKSLLDQIYSLSLLISVPIALVLATIIIVMPVPEPFTKTEWMVALVAIVFEGAIAIGTAWLRLQDDKAKTLLYVMVTTTALQAAFIIIALQFSQTVLSVLLGGLLAAAAQLIWLHFINRYQLVLPSFISTKQFFKYCYPIMCSGLIMFCLNGAERWFIGANASLATLGVYTIAFKFAIGMCFLAQPFAMWWSPRRFSILEKKGANEATRITHLGMIYLTFLVVVVGSLAVIIINNFLPVAYREASLYVLFLLPIALLKEWSDLLCISILYKRKTHWLMGINAIPAAIGLAMLFSLSALGIFGVFIALYYAQLCRLALTFSIGQQCMKLPFHLSLMVILHILAGASLFLIHSTGSTPLIMLVCFTSCVLIATIAFRYFDAQTKSNVHHFWLKWRGQMKRTPL